MESPPFSICYAQGMRIYRRNYHEKRIRFKRGQGSRFCMVPVIKTKTACATANGTQAVEYRRRVRDVVGME